MVQAIRLRPDEIDELAKRHALKSLTTRDITLLFGHITALEHDRAGLVVFADSNTEAEWIRDEMIASMGRQIEALEAELAKVKGQAFGKVTIDVKGEGR